MISGQPYQITYHGGTDGDDVVLTSLVGTTTAVTPSSPAVTYGQPISLTATVTSADSSFTQVPTGSVAFFNNNGANSLGSAPIDSTGVATLTNVVLPGGDNSAITGVYSGDTSFAKSTPAPPVASAVTVAKAATTVSAPTAQHLDARHGSDGDADGDRVAAAGLAGGGAPDRND